MYDVIVMYVYGIGNGKYKYNYKFITPFLNCCRLTVRIYYTIQSIQYTRIWYIQ